MASGLFAAVSIVSQVVGAKRAKRQTTAAANEQAEIDAENIRLEKLETEESISRTELSQKKTESIARTQVASSGFAVGSSLDKYVASIQAEHASDIDWMRTSGASRAEISEREADARRRSTIDSGRASYAAGIGSALTTAATTKW